MRSKDHFILLSLVLVVAGVCIVVKSFRSCPKSASPKAILSSGRRSPSLAVFVLPGYTGWARPSYTLSSRFRIKEHDEIALVKRNWTVTVTCDGCSKDGRPIWFYARAYGPQILVGVVERQVGTLDDYSVRFHPVVEGQYTVEVVLTYSFPVDMDTFPLSEQQLPPPSYEGYLLPGFPFHLIVSAQGSSGKPAPGKGMPYCSIEQLVLTERSRAEFPMWNRASWRVLSTNTHFASDSDSSAAKETGSSASAVVSLDGYASGLNSLGFTAAYELADCRLIEQFAPTAVSNLFPSTCPNPWSPKIHVILIGDSVMRLQKTWIEKQVLSSRDVKVTFLELYGGALRCSRLSGPNITAFVNDPVLLQSTGPRVVVFNTGMHDIHRLCGSQFNDDRPSYLTKNELLLKCTALYRLAIRELATTVVQIPADVYIFQSTTAAWPKYGNYGVAWDPRYAQELPLDSAFVARFNEIAISEVQSLVGTQSKAQGPLIHIVDAYWITLARPDNREISVKAEIGKKLSHPGLEVVSHMVRMWWQVAIQQICAANK